MNEELSDSLDASAITLHEVYASLVRAGFSEDQAFQLIMIQWQETVGNAE